MKSKERLTRAVERGGVQTRIWSNQVDAAAVVGAEAKVDDGGRPRVLGRRKEGDDVKRYGG